MIEDVGPWIGLVGGALAILGYLTLVTQVKVKLDMFITEQRTFRSEINRDFERLGTRLEGAIGQLRTNDLDTAELKIRVAIVERALGVDHESGGEPGEY